MENSTWDVGKGLGMAAGVALAPATGGASLFASTAAAKAIGAGLGEGLGDFGAGKVFDAGTAKSSTGLFRDQFEDLNKRARAEEDAVFKKAAMTGATTYFDATGGMDSLKSSAIKTAGNIFGMDKSPAISRCSISKLFKNRPKDCWVTSWFRQG